MRPRPCRECHLGTRGESKCESGLAWVLAVERPWVRISIERMFSDFPRGMKFPCQGSLELRNPALRPWIYEIRQIRRSDPDHSPPRVLGDRFRTLDGRHAIGESFKHRAPDGGGLSLNGCRLMVGADRRFEDSSLPSATRWFLMVVTLSYQGAGGLCVRRAKNNSFMPLIVRTAA